MLKVLIRLLSRSAVHGGADALILRNPLNTSSNPYSQLSSISTGYAFDMIKPGTITQITQIGFYHVAQILNQLTVTLWQKQLHSVPKSSQKAPPPAAAYVCYNPPIAAVNAFMSG